MAKLTPVFVDLETFWSQEHSLSKMNPIVYCTHKDTEIISCAAAVDKEPVCVSFGEELIKKQFKAFDWSDKIVVAHNNSGFDAMILAWRLGVRPAMYLCTLAMARPHHAKTTGLSLGKLVEHYGIGVKDNSALVNTRGRHLKDFTPDEIEAMRVYNKADTEQCRQLFYKLLPLTSKREMKLIDMTIRMLVQPQFRLDMKLLETTLKEEQARKHEMLLTLAQMLSITGETDEEIAEKTRETLASAAKFKELLESRGVECPVKPSPTNPEKEVPALAKTDEAFIALQESDDPVIAAAAATRLGVKSTLLESRVSAFIDVGRSTGGRFPVPINYYGADTTGRDSGGFGLNAQNLPRISGKPTDALRNSLIAPPHKKIVVADLSGIELRVNLHLWKVPYALEAFKADPEADMYKPLASEVLGVPIEGMPKMVRQAGKAMHLGCGFGLRSKVKYIAVAKQMAGIDVTEDEADLHILGYRGKHPEVVQGWATCHDALTNIYNGREVEIDPWGLCHTIKGGIKTPQGVIWYPGLRQEVNESSGKKEWVYGYGRHKARIYAGKVTENIVQHLAREVVMDNALKIQKDLGFNTAHRVHDELIYVVGEGIADVVLDAVQDVMRTPPTWWPELVVWSEGSIGDTYGETK